MSLELSESDMEEIISKHPEMVEGDLMLKGRQVYVSGLRIDLLFVDKFGDRLIVELKKGTVTRSHVAQLMEYSGAIPEEQRSVTRVMLIANVVPPRWKKALDVHGIEYRELANRDYSEFLKEKDPKLLERLQKKLCVKKMTKKRKKTTKTTTLGQQILTYLQQHANEYFTSTQICNALKMNLKKGGQRTRVRRAIRTLMSHDDNKIVIKMRKRANREIYTYAYKS